MLSNMYNVITAGLFVIALSMGYLSYNFYGKLSVLESRHDVTMLQLKQKDRELDKLTASCQITSTISAQLSKDSQTMGAKLAELAGALGGLEEATEDFVNETTQTVPAVRPVEFDAELISLLDAAYCTAEPSDPYCTAGRFAPKATSDASIGNK